MSIRSGLVHVFFGTLSVLGLQDAMVRAELVALTSDNSLITFSPSSPGTTSIPLPVLGLNAGDTLKGIDFRPATGILYGFAQNGATGNLYTISPLTGMATFASTLSTSIAGASFGVDFNPVPDRLRIVSDVDQNLRINVDTGATIVDGNLAYAIGDANFGTNPNIVAAAYTNSIPGTVATTSLYVLDSTLGILALQNPPNNGTLNTIGLLGTAAGMNTPFDIDGATGFAYAVLGGNALSQIDLANGTTTSLGSIGLGTSIIGLTSEITGIPEPSGSLLIGIATASLWNTRLRRRPL